MPDRTKDAEKAMLEAGVPDAVIAYTLRQGVRQWLHHLGSGFTLALILGGISILYFLALPLLESSTRITALSHAKDEKAILYHYNVGFSVLILFFALFATIPALGQWACLLSEGLRTTSFVFSFLEKNPIIRRLARWRARRLQNEDDPARYVRRMVLGWLPAMTGGAVVLIALGAWAFHRERHSYSLYTSEAYLDFPFFPWNSTEPRRWSSVAAVETGCNHIEDRRETSDKPVYRIRFGDGTVAWLADAKPLVGSWLDAAEEIDRRIRASNAVFTPWDWMGRDPKHPDCIAAFRRQLSPRDFARLERLLRLDE